MMGFKSTSVSAMSLFSAAEMSASRTALGVALLLPPPTAAADMGEVLKLAALAAARLALIRGAVAPRIPLFARCVRGSVRPAAADDERCARSAGERYEDDATLASTLHAAVCNARCCDTPTAAHVVDAGLLVVVAAVTDVRVAW